MNTVVSYGCVTSAGPVEELWQALKTGRDCSSADGFVFPGGRESSILDLLTRQLSVSFRAAIERAPAKAAARLLQGNYGVILASTKGCSNDFIWSPPPEQLLQDPVTPLLNSVISRLELQPKRSVVVSNACSSALAAARLAQIWLKQGLSDVIVLAADANTPFVRNGFESLKLLSRERPRPFSSTRDGFLLGEAAACLWLSREESGALRLHPVGLDSEGSTVTRPGPSSESLTRAARGLPAPDVVVAHGTGTVINDQTEDLALQRICPDTPVTGSKWCTGHTLAASGAIDMILACEMLNRGESFALETTETADPQFKINYLTRGIAAPVHSRVLVTSLGFGGMHAAALLEKV